MNYAQLIYEANSVILPRDIGISKEFESWLQAQNVPNDKAHELAAVSYALWNYDRDENLFDFTDDNEDDSDSETVLDENINATQTYQKTSESAPSQPDSVLQKQIKSLQESLTASERTNQALRKKLAQITDERKNDADELANLRETLFRIKYEEEYEGSPQKLIIEFPYHTQRRICIFGGHDSWRKQIKPLLPDASFYDRDTFPHPDSIKNADIVWIQANSMSHSYFYRVIDVAREHSIPYRYFGFASVRKCAEQVVMEEMMVKL